MNFLRKDLSVFLLVTGTLVCLFAILPIRGITVAAGSEFGRMNYVPFTFWIGFFVAIVGAFVVVFSDNKRYYVISMLLITLIVWHLPTLMDLMPREHDSYGFWATSDWIYKHGHIRFNAEGRGLSYLQYPAVFLLGTIFRYIVAIDPLNLLLIFQAIFGVLWTINFYILAADALDSPKKAYIATLAPTIANIFQFVSHFSPKALATSLFPLILFFVFGKRKIRLWIFILLFGYLTYITFHPILPLFILMLTLVFLLLTKTIGRQISKRFRLITPIFSIFPVSYTAWSMFIGLWAFDDLINFGREFISNISSFVFVRRLTESYGTAIRSTPLTISIIRWTITLFFVVPSFILILRNNRKRVDWISSSFLSTLFLAFGVGMTTFGLYLTHRILFLLIPLSSLLIVKHIKSTRHLVLFLAAVIMLSSLNILAYYHAEIQHIVSKAEYEGGFFLANTIKNDDRVLMDFPQMLPFFTEHSKDPIVPHSYYDLYNLSLVNKSTTVFFSYSSFRRYYKIEGSANNSLVYAKLHLVKDPTFNKIYDSSDIRIFRRNQ